MHAQNQLPPIGSAKKLLLYLKNDVTTLQLDQPSKADEQGGTICQDQLIKGVGMSFVAKTSADMIAASTLGKHPRLCSI